MHWLTIEVAGDVARQGKDGGRVGLACLEHHGVFGGSSSSCEGNKMSKRLGIKYRKI